MDFSNQKISIREARQMDMVDYLAGLGFQPVKIRGVDYWYLSPLREENEASFKVNRKINRWFDYGMGKGGNLVDFAILYNNCTVGDLLRGMNHQMPVRRPLPHQPEKYRKFKERKLIIIDTRPLVSASLIRYLRERRIPTRIADAYCRELIYEVGRKVYSGIGFKNDAGGFEIRSRFFKGCHSPKDITTERNHSKTVAVFEGFMDFLSFKVTGEAAFASPPDYVVLNSIALFKRARPFMEDHKNILLYLDHDRAGEACLHQALAIDKRYQDAGTLYKGYKDLNDWMIHFGQAGWNSTTNKKK